MVNFPRFTLTSAPFRRQQNPATATFGLKADGESRLSALLFQTQEADEEEEKAEADEPEKQRNAEGGKENSYVRDKKYCTTHESSLSRVSFPYVSPACNVCL